MKNKGKQELMLKVGAAGGSLSIWAVHAKDGTRSFLVKQDESTLRGMLDKEDASTFNYYSETGQLRSFADALDVLGQYPWYGLSPIFVHQDFLDIVLTTVANLGGEKEVHRWQRKLDTHKPLI